MIHATIRLVTDPRFKLMLMLLMMSMILFACDDPWDKFPDLNR